MSYLYVEWNRFELIRSPTLDSLEHVLTLTGHSRNGGLRRRGRRA